MGADRETTEQKGDRLETDGGQESVDYLDEKIHMFKPATPFMRDHLKVIWGLFAVWAVFTFGPVTATALATDFMTSTHVLGFQLHYLTTALGAPIGALVLCAVYFPKRRNCAAMKISRMKYPVVQPTTYASPK